MHFAFSDEKSSNLRTTVLNRIPILTIRKSIVLRLLDFSSQNAKRIHSNVGVGLKFFYEVKYHARTVPGMLCRPPKVILQVPVAPKPSKIIKISMIFMDFHRNPNETSVKQAARRTKWRPTRAASAVPENAKTTIPPDYGRAGSIKRWSGSIKWCLGSIKWRFASIK